MKFILGLLGGAGGGWMLAGGLILAGLLGAASGYLGRGVIDAPIISHQETLTAQADARTAQCTATHEKARADGGEQVITALGLAAANVTSALNSLAAKAAERGKTLDQFLKDIANAPPSKVCAGSAAELAFRRSVQPGP